MIKGITVTIHQKTVTGQDAFNRDVITTTPVEVANVLVGLPTEDDIEQSTNLTGRRAEYILGIPKGDTHDWTDIDVEFFGDTFHTIGEKIMGIEAMIPLDWNAKVRVMRANGRPKAQQDSD